MMSFSAGDVNLKTWWFNGQGFLSLQQQHVCFSFVRKLSREHFLLWISDTNNANPRFFHFQTQTNFSIPWVWIYIFNRLHVQILLRILQSQSFPDNSTFWAPDLNIISKTCEKVEPGWFLFVLLHRAWVGQRKLLSSELLFANLALKKYHFPNWATLGLKDLT